MIVKETIEIVNEYVYNSASKPGYDKKHFQKLLELATGAIFCTKIGYFVKIMVLQWTHHKVQHLQISFWHILKRHS